MTSLASKDAPKSIQNALINVRLMAKNSKRETNSAIKFEKTWKFEVDDLSN